MPPRLRTPQPVTPDPPHPAMNPLMTQSWLDLTLPHRAAVDGVTHVGLVPLRTHRVGRPLRRAGLLECDESLVTAAGLPAPVGEPLSVMDSPGVQVRFGRPVGP
ncbi:hypothetical protein ACFYQ5_15060 [Streptomyces sp. NPDC005794]|uniref:hypothetical protein n=1 Tax=Streptomyces sp. NPDC005794 TaxID=3364733 RepID=UPI0036B15C24